MVDAITQAQIWESILGIVEKMDIGVLVVSHEKKLMNRLCHDVIDISRINKT
jgi:peptide/nickel transport system ATP-binding protein